METGKMLFVAVVVTLCVCGVSGQGTVTLQLLTDSTVCGGSQTTVRCETTVTGILEWRNATGETVRFINTNDDPGATGSLGPVALNLTEESGDTLVSIATVASTMSDVLLFCFNTVRTETITGNVAGRPSAPLNFACDYNNTDNSIQCTSDAPADCCSQSWVVINELGKDTYKKQNERFNITSDATVGGFCRDGLGRNGSISNLELVPFLRVVLNASGVDCSSSEGSVRVTPRTGSTIAGVTCMFGNVPVTGNMATNGDGSYTCEYTNNAIRGVRLDVMVNFNDGSSRMYSSDICEQFPLPDDNTIWIIIICVLAVLLIVVIIVVIVMTILYIQLKGGKDSASGDNSVKLNEKY